MKIRVCWVGGCFLFLGGLSWSPLSIAREVPIPLVETLSLEESVDLELKQQKSYLNQNVIEEIKSHHHVLVPGMMNEVANFFGLYYVELTSFFSSNGIDYTYLGLPTKTAVLENSDYLNLKLREIHSKQTVKRALVLRGHSKGGLEILMTILRYPDLILSGIVDGVLLEQAALGGSPLASPRKLSLLNPLSYFYLKDGLESVHPTNAKENLNQAFDGYDQAIKDYLKSVNEPESLLEAKKAEISSRIGYVRSYQDPDKLSLGTKLVLWTCNQTLEDLEEQPGVEKGQGDGVMLLEHKKDDPEQKLNDGLVPLAHQKDDRIGFDLGILKLDHVAFNLSWVSNTTQEERMAIVRAVLGAFYKLLLDQRGDGDLGLQPRVSGKSELFNSHS